MLNVQMFFKIYLSKLNLLEIIKIIIKLLVKLRYYKVRHKTVDVHANNNVK